MQLFLAQAKQTIVWQQLDTCGNSVRCFLFASYLPTPEWRAAVWFDFEHFDQKFLLRHEKPLVTDFGGFVRSQENNHPTLIGVSLLPAPGSVADRCLRLWTFQRNGSWSRIQSQFDFSRKKIIHDSLFFHWVHFFVLPVMRAKQRSCRVTVSFVMLYSGARSSWNETFVLFGSLFSGHVLLLPQKCHPTARTKGDNSNLWFPKYFRISVWKLSWPRAFVEEERKKRA